MMLRVVEPPTPTPIDGRERVVALLDTWLAMARSGELTSVALAGVVASNEVVTSWIVSAPGNILLLSAAAQHMAYRLHAEAWEEP